MEQTIFYVSTQGNDSWSGRLPQPNAAGGDGPFATLHRARNAVRELKAKAGEKGLAQPVQVRIRGGQPTPQPQGGGNVPHCEDAAAELIRADVHVRALDAGIAGKVRIAGMDVSVVSRIDERRGGGKV